MAISRFKSRNKDMFLGDWYNNYLMEYLRIFDNPKYTTEQLVKYNEILLRWYDNWEGWNEEVKND